MSEESLVTHILLAFSGSAFGILVLVVYLFNRPDKFEHWMKMFYHVLYTTTSAFPKIKGHIDRRLVASSIQDTVNQVSDQINDESPGSLPHAMKVEWVKSDTREAFIAKGRVHVRLMHYGNQERNIVEATLLYIKHGFLPRAKNYLDNTLRRSCEYRFASRVFVGRRDTGAYEYFFDNEIRPAIENDVKVRDDLQMLENLDSVGFFTRVFLSEISITGQKLLGTVPTEGVRAELREFARFLDTIAIKAKEQNVLLAYWGSRIKVSVILVARRDTIDSYGIDPYVSRIQRVVRQGYDSIYLAGWGDAFIRSIIQIKKQIGNDILEFIRRYDYPVHGTSKAVLMVCQPKSSYLARQKQLHDEVREAFAEIVPEVKEGLIRIVAVARMKDVGLKVAVSATRAELGNPCRCCIGPNAERVKRLKERFAPEFVGVARWSDDIKEFVRSAISPLNPRYIDRIEIDEENLIADVTVMTRESASKGIGRNSHNVRLASELTGYLIHIQAPASSDERESPEEELRAILRREIPEILNNEIEIVSLARIKGVGSKVIVKWKDSQMARKYRASKACHGDHYQNSDRIKEYFRNELLHFHDWCQSVEEQIALCLFPVKKSDIGCVEIDESSMLAVVTLKGGAGIGSTDEVEQGVALCEMVTGFDIEFIEV